MQSLAFQYYRLRNRLPWLFFANFKQRISGGLLDYPFAIQYNVTYRCNLKCIYCDCGVTKHTNYEMSTPEIFRMIDEFVALGTRRLSITGGEPLLKDNLPEIVMHAKKRGLYVSVATNGVMLPRKIEELLSVDSFNITLDGPEPINDLQRGAGSFTKVIRAVEALKAKRKSVYLNCVLTKNNAGSISEILALADELKVKMLLQPVFYSELSHAGTLEGYQKAKYEDAVLQDALTELIRLKQKGYPRLMLSEKYYRDVLNYLVTGKKMKCAYAKEKGALFCTISPEGTVTPCNLLVRDKRYLNGNELGYKQAFQQMPQLSCEGCISSFIDIDYLLTLDQSVLLNYAKHSF